MVVLLEVVVVEERRPGKVVVAFLVEQTGVWVDLEAAVVIHYGKQ